MSLQSKLGPSPILRAGDVEGAKVYLSRIHQVLKRDDLSLRERRRIYRIKNKWKRRAEGRDQRFMLVGTWQGGLTANERNHIKAMEVIQGIREDVYVNQPMVGVREKATTPVTTQNGRRGEPKAPPRRKHNDAILPPSAGEQPTVGWGGRRYRVRTTE